MDRIILFTNIFLVFMGALNSCTPVDKEMETATPPSSLVSLVDAYHAGKTIELVSFANGATTLSFTDGSVLVVPQSEVRISDCTSSRPSTVGVSPGTSVWSVAGLVTGIRYTPELEDRESLSVYVYYDGITVHVFLSNGSALVFASRQDDLLRRRNIPVVRITTEGPVVSKEDYVNGSMEISDPEGLYGPSETFKAGMKIRGRGNSTWGMPKKPYKIKLESKASLLGMPADKEWALLANYADKTLLRNVVAMHISEICGFSWTPAMVSVEVYMNGAYQGVYTLCEHKKVSSSRVDIEVVTETDTDITGGYYLEIEQNMDETTCFWTTMGVPMMFQEPEIPTPAQLAYVKGLFSDFETSLQNPDSGKDYRDYIDEKSFIDNYIIQELTKNIDGNLRKSTFLTKERGGKLEMYHVWDFDLTLGNCNYFTSDVPGMDNSYRGFFIRDYSLHGKNTGWYHYLFKDKDFENKVSARWKELLPQLRLIPEFIREQAFILEDAQKRNFERWKILNEYVWPNEKVLGNYKAEVDYLVEFYSSRLEWLDAGM